MYKRKRIVVALGGNALGNTLPEQMIAVKSTAKALCDLIEEGHQVVVKDRGVTKREIYQALMEIK